MTPEPEEDFVDPVDEYKMPWEEDTPLPEGVSSKAGSNASSFAASIGLEISGSEEFVAADACALVLKFRDIFSTELSPEPADLSPLDVLIDTTAKWYLPKNQGRPRNKSVKVQQEIKRHLEKLLKCGAISPALHASAYSQVLLVTKPDTNEKHLVLDYRALNESVGHTNWPLPNISHMIKQIGALKPKKLAKFDMTKGYWQLDLAPAVRQATVFVTWMGIFVWNRIPMGLQSAASYF